MSIWMLFGTVVIIATCGVTPSAIADVLLEQPVDFVNRWDSYYTPIGVQHGDDYWIDEPTVVTSVTFWMVATYPNSPWEWSFSVHRGYHDHPGYDFAPFIDHFYRMFGPSSVVDLGPWPGEANLHFFEVRFDNVNLLLEPYLKDDRAFWFSCAGHLLHYPTDRVYWATSGNGVINGHMGYQKFEPPDYPGWRRIADAGLPASDFAMRIEGVPARQYQPTTELTDMRLEWGTYVDGDLDSLREAGDGEILTLRAQSRGPEWFRRIIVDARFTTLVSSPELLDVSVCGSFTIGGTGTAEMFLRDWSTDEFVSVGTYPIAHDMNTWPIRGIPADRFIRSGDGAIDLRIEYRVNIVPRGTWMSRSVPVELDCVKIDARQTN